MPRIGRQTPTRSLVLPYRESLGAGAVAVYESSGREAQEWQKRLLFDILAVNEDGLYTHTKFGYAVPRRNGKNEILVAREMDGLKRGERILHTAHRTTTSHAAWERLTGLLDKAKIPYKAIRATGREYVELEETGGRVDFRTRSAKGGLGEGFDLLIIDEAQEYQDDQESALKYVVSDSRNPQTIFCGTPPTAVSSGTVFLKLRNNALRGNTENTGWAEWSVNKKTDPQDREAWYMTNPSLGTILSERKIADEIGSDEIDFNIQRLGLWLRYNQKSAISENEWRALQVSTLPSFKGKLFAGIKIGHDGKNAALSVAVRTQEGKIFAEAIDCRPIAGGFAWIIDFISRAELQEIWIDGANGQQLIADAMRERKMKSPHLPTVKEVVAASAAFEQAVFAAEIQHKGQPSLAAVVTNCDKRAIGTGGGFGYRSLMDDMEIALMESVIFAFYACSKAKEIRKQKIGY